MEIIAKNLFSDLRPRAMVTKGSERRESRRKVETEEIERLKSIEEQKAEAQLIVEAEKKLGSGGGGDLRQRHVVKK